jgi:2'-5' RNA ligase
LWPSDEQRAALTRVQRDLPGHRARLAHPEDLHITLVFLGDLDADRRACAEAAAECVRTGPFALTLNRFGCFPRARVLWCGAAARPQSLMDLLSALNSGLSSCGFRPERRSFAPHVTLARKARPLPDRELVDPIAWPVSEFVLAIARQGERPRYRVLRRWSLDS